MTSGYDPVASWTKPYLGNLRLHKLFLSPLNPLTRLGARGDKRERNLSIVLIRHSNNADVGYERVVEEMALEFRWCDLETTNLHDLLEAVNDENIVVGVDDSFISCADPSSNHPSQSPSK